MAGHPTARLQATGRLEAVVAISDLPAGVAATLLPPGLELLPETLAPAGRHPLVLLFGEHSRVGLDRLPFGLRYRELVLALPFVRPRGGPPGPFCHLPILVLDRHLPTWLGRWLYGFAKHRATIRRAGGRFEIARQSDETLLFSARIRPSAAAVELESVRGLLEQPLIDAGRGGRWRYARFDFGFERARLAAVEAGITVHPGLLAGLPAGQVPIRSAFRLETTWRLSHFRPSDRAHGCAGVRPGPRTGRS
jgi:hypothetical protein